MNISYISICVLLALICVLLLFEFVRRMIFKNKKQPLYLKKLPQKEYTDDFLQAIQIAYDTTKDIKGMLLLLKDNWSNGVAGKRVCASLDYLENSRYRDYETTLYYLSDQSKACEAILEAVLAQEIRKRRGLICKN